MESSSCESVCESVRSGGGGGAVGPINRSVDRNQSNENTKNTETKRYVCMYVCCMYAVVVVVVAAAAAIIVIDGRFVVSLWRSGAVRVGRWWCCRSYRSIGRSKSIERKYQKYRNDIVYRIL